LRKLGEVVSELTRILLAGKPVTFFNGHVSTLRRVVWTSFSLNEVKAIKNRLGGTVNDVVLATITAALRGYLEAHGADPDRVELQAALPVNVRATHEHLALGNRVSSLVAPLPIGIFDPLERLRQVRTATAQLKRRGQSIIIGRALDLLDLVPPPLQTPLGWLQLIGGMPVNTICTNVPGPPVSLYVQGKRLETLVPVVPLAHGVGLAFAILSYADMLTIGINADPALVPDGERLCELLQAGLDELRTLAGVDRTVPRVVSVLPERQRRRTAPPSQVA
jgi:diacylglycerol O-acyltransferase